MHIVMYVTFESFNARQYRDVLFLFRAALDWGGPEKSLAVQRFTQENALPSAQHRRYSRQ
jgi:hypothetical protein